MSYIVPGMTLIPQDRGTSCWFAAAQMLITWRRDSKQMCEPGILDPVQDPESFKKYNDFKGITDAEIVGLAKRLGLKIIPPMSPTPGAIESWLRQFGPLWVNGATHIVVIAGIAGDHVLVYDPLPVNVGNVSWRSLSSWYAFGGAIDSRDMNTTTGIFMYVPNSARNPFAGVSL